MRSLCSLCSNTYRLQSGKSVFGHLDSFSLILSGSVFFNQFFFFNQFSFFYLQPNLLLLLLLQPNLLLLLPPSTRSPVDEIYFLSLVLFEMEMCSRMVPRSMVSHHDCCFITSESSDEKKKERLKGEKTGECG